MNLYVETSSVLKWLLQQGDFTEPVRAINAAENVVSSVLTIMEAKRALLRAPDLKEAQRKSLEGVLEAAAFQWTLMQITEEIQKRVGESFPEEPVRTLDAVHLATALEFSKVFPDLQLLSSDLRILKNLNGLGLRSAR